eukprot:7384936-Alexandrium_andersonii.AAC.1
MDRLPHLGLQTRDGRNEPLPAWAWHGKRLRREQGAPNGAVMGANSARRKTGTGLGSRTTPDWHSAGTGLVLRAISEGHRMPLMGLPCKRALGAAQG